MKPKDVFGALVILAVVAVTVALLVLFKDSVWAIITIGGLGTLVFWVVAAKYPFSTLFQEGVLGRDRGSIPRVPEGKKKMAE